MNSTTIREHASWLLGLCLCAAACDVRNDTATTASADARAITPAAAAAPEGATPRAKAEAATTAAASDRGAATPAAVDRAATPALAGGAANPVAAVEPARGGALEGITPIPVKTVTTPTALAVAASAEKHGVSVQPQSYVNPPRTGDAKEDYWTQFEVWGEFTNHSDDVMETIGGRIAFFDASGRMLGIDSIASAAQRDFGDDAPGENVRGQVHFVAPGASVPFHYMRNLAAIDGEVASFALFPQGGLVATQPVPRATAVDVRDSVDGTAPTRKRLLHGTIRNDGEGGCRAPNVVVALFDADGRIRGVESLLTGDDLTATIAKGSSGSFDVRVFATAENDWKADAKIETWIDCQPQY